MKAKVLICAGLSAAILGGGIFAAAPKTPVRQWSPRVSHATHEACVVYAQSGGYCVIPGRSPGADSGQWTADNEPVILRTTGIRRAVGVLPEDAPAEKTPSVSAEGADSFPEGDAKGTVGIDAEELELLACAIYCEAGGDTASDETRRMVGEVILNRAADPRFPASIAGVLTQKSQYGRFHWTGVVWPSRAAHEPEAVERAYRCAEAACTEPRLLPEDVVFQAEFIQGEVVATAPGYYFCR